MELKRITPLRFHHGTGLLIVPYGIETNMIGRNTVAKLTFNRTLWN